MKETLLKKIEILEKEFAAGQQRAAQLQQALGETQATIIRIQGAITVCREIIMEEETTPAQPSA